MIHIPVNSFSLEGELIIPQNALGLVVFVHGSGSSRLSPRNNFVAHHLNEAKLATLLIDLLSKAEDTVYETRFDIGLLTARVHLILAWLQENSSTKHLPLGLFGASTGAAAALKAAAQDPERVKAVVSRGGRPDLAEGDLRKVKAPTLLIVGGEDKEVLSLNEEAAAELSCIKKIEIVPRATHLFEEEGCLEQVAHLARQWFLRHLKLDLKANARPQS